MSFQSLKHLKEVSYGMHINIRKTMQVLCTSVALLGACSCITKTTSYEEVISTNTTEYFLASIPESLTQKVTCPVNIFLDNYHETIQKKSVQKAKTLVKDVSKSAEKKAVVETSTKVESFSEKKQNYSENDLELLAHAINAENGIEYESEYYTNALQIYTGQVILNRVKSHFMGANTIEEVLYSPHQYSCVSDWSWDNPISKRAYKNARILLEGKPYWEIYGITKMPETVMFQADFSQGSGVWLEMLGVYYCYS